MHLRYRDSLAKPLAARQGTPVVAALLPFLPVNVGPDRIVESVCIALLVTVWRAMRRAVNIDFAWLEYGQRRRGGKIVSGIRKSDRVPCREIPLLGTPLAVRVALNVPKAAP